MDKTKLIGVALLSIVAMGCGVEGGEEGDPAAGEKGDLVSLTSSKEDLPSGIKLAGALSCANNAAGSLVGSFQGYGWQSARQYTLQRSPGQLYTIHFKVNYAPGGGAAIAVFEASTGKRLALARTPATANVTSYDQKLVFSSLKASEVRVAVYSTTDYANGAYRIWMECGDASCQALGDSASCHAQPQCVWGGEFGCFVKTCGHQEKDEVGCKASEGCEWRQEKTGTGLFDFTDYFCRATYSCKDYGASEICAGNGCKWAGGTCAEVCRYLSGAACLERSDCERVILNQDTAFPIVTCVDRK